MTEKILVFYELLFYTEFESVATPKLLAQKLDIVCILDS